MRPNENKEAQRLIYKKSKYINSANVEYEMLSHTGNHWGHNCNYGIKKYLEVPGKHSIISLQKAALRGTSQGKCYNLKPEI